VSDDQAENPVTEEQARQNRTTRHQWGFYDSHRRSLEQLIVPETRGGRICILGAGNCNDLDLQWLAEVYGEVHLVDLDANSLESAVRRQKLEHSASIHRHAPVDLTGIAPQVATWAQFKPDEAEIVQATRTLLELPRPQWGEFDLVLSPCVLTQTMNPARNALRDHYPPSHPFRTAIRSALRLRHLRFIAACLSPGGRGVLAIDLISTETFAELPRVPPERLDDLMRTFLADGKHYTGVDPASLSAAWRGDPDLSRQLAAPQFTPPWHWHLGLRKSFLVYGTTFVRRDAGRPLSS
jgi:hypothetical protein